MFYSALVHNSMANPSLKLKGFGVVNRAHCAVGLTEAPRVIQNFSRQRTPKNVLIAQLICMKHLGSLSQHSLAELCPWHRPAPAPPESHQQSGTVAQPDGHWHSLSNTAPTNPALVHHHSNHFNTSPTSPRPVQWPLTSPALAEASHPASELKIFAVKKRLS